MRTGQPQTPLTSPRAGVARGLTETMSPCVEGAVSMIVTQICFAFGLTGTIADKSESRASQEFELSRSSQARTASQLVREE